MTIYLDIDIASLKWMWVLNKEQSCASLDFVQQAIREKYDHKCSELTLAVWYNNANVPVLQYRCDFQRQDARIIVGVFYEDMARRVFCQVG